MMAYRVLIVGLFLIIINAASAAPSDEGNKPAFDCPKENEYYEKCALAVCYKTCQHLVKPPPCPSIASPCIDPKCVCKEDFLRNENGECIHFEKCSEFKTQQMMLGRI